MSTVIDPPLQTAIGRFCCLASGSRGNSLYFETPKAKILIDAGLSGRMTKQRLQAIGVAVDEIDAIIITHEHGDHTKGLKILALRHRIPVFANRSTLASVSLALSERPMCKVFFTDESFSFRDMVVHPFSIPHDAVDPVGLVIEVDGIRWGFCTDLGFVPSLLGKRLRQLDYLYIEANHDPKMVDASPLPLFYKNRVLGKYGHLSNQACACLIAEVYSSRLKCAYLAHLSQECNTPERAKESIASYLQENDITLPLVVTAQNEASLVYSF